MLTVFVIVALTLALALVVRPELGISIEGRAFAFVALLLLPVTAGLLGAEQQIEHSKQTVFCTSCHVMELHGRSLRVDDDTILAASHFQGGRVPRETACFSCHTTYTMFGDLSAKLRGLRHVWVNYVKGPPKETEIHLYAPYHNRECLYCHGGARRFEQGKVHRLEPGRMEKIRRNELSCVDKTCHGTVHEVGGLDGIPEWSPPPDDPTKGGRP
jgi:hypothetical protein